MFMAVRFHLPFEIHSPFHIHVWVEKAWAFLTYGSFAQAFWPSTAANLVGLILGLPLALALNRIWLSYTNRSEHSENQRRLKEAIQVLAATLDANADRLVVLQNKLRNKLCPFDSGLDITSWEVVKPELVQFLRDPQLQSGLARHFSELASASRLTSQYLGYVAGVEAALGGIEVAREKLRVHLLTEAERLAQDGRELHSRLQQLNQQEKPRRRRLLRRSAGR